MQTELTRNQEIAQVIAQQLGGTRRISVMTGAHSFVAIENGLAFRLPGKGFAKDSINVVSIVLTPSDDYTMTFSRLRGSTLKEIRKYQGVYCDQLVELFEEATGLYLSF